MNIKIFRILKFIILITFLVSCNNNDDITLNSNLKATISSSNSELDAYLSKNFVEPYNIEVLYKFEESLLLYYGYYVPVDVSKVQFYGDLLINLWIKPYEKVGGDLFIKDLAPRQIVLVGSTDGYRFDTKLGIDGGVRITLYNLNEFNTTTVELIEKGYKDILRLIQLGYVQLMIQRNNFEIDKFKLITPGSYTSNWINIETDSVARELGFVTRYARKNEKIDFVETAAEIVLSSPVRWKNILSKIQDNESRQLINRKVEIVDEYFKKIWKLDIFKLQTEVSNALIKTISETPINKETPTN